MPKNYKSSGMNKRQYKMTKGKSYTKSKNPSKQLIQSVGIPNRLLVRLKYQEYDKLDYNGTVAGSTLYRLNSSWDPYVATGGKSALYHMYYSGVYLNYRVYGAKVVIKGLPTSNLPTGFQWRVVAAPVFTATGNSISTMEDLDNLSMQRYATDIIATQANGFTIKRYYNLPKVKGISRLTYKGSDVFESAVQSVPPAYINLQIAGQPSTPTGAPASTMTLFVKIIYYVEFFNPKSYLQPNEVADTGPTDAQTGWTEVGLE